MGNVYEARPTGKAGSADRSKMSIPDGILNIGSQFKGNTNKSEQSYPPIENFGIEIVPGYSGA